MTFPHAKSGAVWVGFFLSLTGGSALAQSAPTLTEGAKWESSAAFGFTMTQGNSDTILSTLNLTSNRRWDRNEIVVAGSMTYGESEDRINADNQRLAVQYNRQIGDRGFFYGRSEWFRDAVAELDYRITVSPGGGYFFWRDDKKGFLRTELGPGYVLEEKGGELENHYTVRAAERFEYRINSTMKLWQSLEYTPDVDEFADFRVIAEVGLETSLTKAMSLRTYVQDAYDNQPARGREGNDLKLVTQIGYKF